jgi:dTDP-4-dehydrorhamnose 3,5-epimerase
MLNEAAPGLTELPSASVVPSAVAVPVSVHAVSAIHGARSIPLSRKNDLRGSFLETFKQSWDLPVRPAQWSVVRSLPRALRGLYVHLRHDEMFVLVQGRALVGLKDLRPSSPSFGRSVLLEMDGAAPMALAFPPGCLHGWYFLEDSLHLQGVSEEWESYAPDDNLACRWSDPEVGLAWPDPAPLISPEATQFGSFRALLDRLALSGRR